MPATELCAGATVHRGGAGRSPSVLLAREYPRPARPRDTRIGEWRGLAAIDAAALAAPLAVGVGAVAVHRALPHDAAAVAAGLVRAFAVAGLLALVAVARGHRVDAPAVVITRLIVLDAVAVAGAGFLTAGDGEAPPGGRAALEAGVALGVQIAALPARTGFDPNALGRGPLERETTEDRGQSAACQTAERLSARRLRGTQDLRQCVKSLFVHECFPSDSHVWGKPAHSSRSWRGR